jgi:hypothetical protein
MHNLPFSHAIATTMAVANVTVNAPGVVAVFAYRGPSLCDLERFLATFGTALETLAFFFLFSRHGRRLRNRRVIHQ